MHTLSPHGKAKPSPRRPANLGSPPSPQHKQNDREASNPIRINIQVKRWLIERLNPGIANARTSWISNPSQPPTTHPERWQARGYHACCQCLAEQTNVFPMEWRIAQ